MKKEIDKSKKEVLEGVERSKGIVRPKKESVKLKKEDVDLQEKRNTSKSDQVNFEKKCGEFERKSDGLKREGIVKMKKMLADSEDFEMCSIDTSFEGVDLTEKVNLTDERLLQNLDRRNFEFEPNDTWRRETGPSETLSTFELLVKPIESKKRNRTIMSNSQSTFLRNFFKKTPFPDTSTREALARHLQMKPRTVQIWFQNMRQKNKPKGEGDRTVGKLKFKNVEFPPEPDYVIRDASKCKILPITLKNNKQDGRFEGAGPFPVKRSHSAENLANNSNLYRYNDAISTRADTNYITKLTDIKINKIAPAEYLKEQDDKNEQKEHSDGFKPEDLDLRGLNALAAIAEGILDGGSKDRESQR